MEHWKIIGLFFKHVKLIVQHQTIVSVTETSSNMASTLCFMQCSTLKHLIYISYRPSLLFSGKKYTSGPRYWNVPVLVNTGTFLVYQYCLKMWYLRSLESAGVIQKFTILERKNGPVLSNTCVPVSGTWSILFPFSEKVYSYSCPVVY